MSIQKHKNKILEIAQPIIDKSVFNLYELNIVNDFDSVVLQFLVENKIPTDPLDIDMLVNLNNSISEELDKITELNDKYILEVSSAGIERTVKNEETLINSVGEYFFVTSNKKNIESFNGVLKSYDKENKLFNFTYFIKGKPTKLSIGWSEIEFIRFAIKF